jgi:hypothetical protein
LRWRRDSNFSPWLRKGPPGLRKDPPRQTDFWRATTIIHITALLIIQSTAVDYGLSQSPAPTDWTRLDRGGPPPLRTGSVRASRSDPLCSPGRTVRNTAHHEPVMVTGRGSVRQLHRASLHCVHSAARPSRMRKTIFFLVFCPHGHLRCGHDISVTVKRWFIGEPFFDISQDDSTLLGHSRCCLIDVLGQARSHLGDTFATLSRLPEGQRAWGDCGCLMLMTLTGTKSSRRTMRNVSGMTLKR